MSDIPFRIGKLEAGVADLLRRVGKGEGNPCHNPAGPGGGQFCSTEGEKGNRAWPPSGWTKDQANAVAIGELDPPSPPDKFYRGMESGNPKAALRESEFGELGRGIYVTPERWLAASYGGGPKASETAGTRSVHEFKFKRKLYPDEVGYLVGGRSGSEDAKLISGNGIELWAGKLTGALAERPTFREMNDAARGSGLRLLMGMPDSVAINQAVILDASIVKM